MDRTPLPPTDRIVPCTANQWTAITRPTTGADATAFVDAERQLRAKHPDRDAENWQTWIYVGHGRPEPRKGHAEWRRDVGPRSSMQAVGPSIPKTRVGGPLLRARKRLRNTLAAKPHSRAMTGSRAAGTPLDGGGSGRKFCCWSIVQS